MTGADICVVIWGRDCSVGGRGGASRGENMSM